MWVLSRFYLSAVQGHPTCVGSRRHLFPVKVTSFLINPGWLGYIGDEILPRYERDYFINHDIRISLNNQDSMENRKGFFSWLNLFINPISALRSAMWYFGCGEKVCFTVVSAVDKHLIPQKTRCKRPGFFSEYSNQQFSCQSF